MTQPEKTDVVTPPVQEAKTTTGLALEDPQEVHKAIVDSMEPRSSGGTKVAAAETPNLPLPEVKTVPQQIKATPTQPITPEEKPRIAENHLRILPDKESIDLSAETEYGHAISLTEDEEYQIPAPEIEVNSIDTELGEVLVEDSEFGEPSPLDEFQPSLDIHVMSSLQEETDSEDFFLPIAEIQRLDLPEYVSESSETVHELSVPVEEMEQTILELAERIEELEAEETEIVHQMLDEIVLKVEGARAAVESNAENQEDTLKAEEVEVELKELFTQLFDHVEIEYTPELIEAYVKLAANVDISELILAIEREEDSSSSHDRGTHEAIKQLLAVIVSLKKTILQAYHIGKSALRLYSQQLETVGGI